jgi:hypothetical protein
MSEVGLVELPACCYEAHKNPKRCNQGIGDCCYNTHEKDKRCPETALAETLYDE